MEPSKRVDGAAPSCLSVHLPSFTFLLSLTCPHIHAMRRWTRALALLAPFISDVSTCCPPSTPHITSTAPFPLPAWPSLHQDLCPHPEHYVFSLGSSLDSEKGTRNCCFQPVGDIRPQGSKHLARLSQRPGRKWVQLIHSCLPRLEYKWGDGKINLFKNAIS